MTTYAVTLDPIDPLLFGDNRTARVGEDHLQLDQDPSPITIHGAIGQFIVDRVGGAWPDQLLGARQPNVMAPRGPIAGLLGYCYRDGRGRRWYPKPRHVHCRYGLGFRGKEEAWVEGFLRPETPSDAASSCPFANVLFAPKSNRPEMKEIEVDLVIEEGVLGELLAGQLPPSQNLRPVGMRPVTDLYRRDIRAGIGIDNSTGRVQEGLLFTRPYRAFAPAGLDESDVFLGHGYSAWLSPLAPLDGLDSSLNAIANLGGDKRRARVQLEKLADDPLADLRDGVINAATDSHGFLAYLLTPSVLGDRIEVAGCAPIAAATGKPLFASGWDRSASAPRPIHALIPAGSVYFFKWPEGADRSALVSKWWLGSVSQSGKEVGFGRILIGVWR